MFDVGGAASGEGQGMTKFLIQNSLSPGSFGRCAHHRLRPSCVSQR